MYRYTVRVHVLCVYRIHIYIYIHTYNMQGPTNFSSRSCDRVQILSHGEFLQQNTTTWFVHNSNTFHTHTYILTYRWTIMGAVWHAKKAALPYQLSCQQQSYHMTMQFTFTHSHVATAKAQWFASSRRLNTSNSKWMTSFLVDTIEHGPYAKAVKKTCHISDDWNSTTAATLHKSLLATLRVCEASPWQASSFWSDCWTGDYDSDI